MGYPEPTHPHHSLPSIQFQRPESLCSRSRLSKPTATFVLQLAITSKPTVDQTCTT
ncbi:unnamed protein product, partial [Nesidiocoris tenuis]